MKWIKFVWKKYLTISFPLRLFIGGVVAVLGGSPVVVFLNEYASYAYSFHYGIRPSFDGIPYLNLAVTSITFLTYLTSVSVLIIFAFFSRLVFLFYSKFINSFFLYMDYFFKNLLSLFKNFFLCKGKITSRNKSFLAFPITHPLEEIPEDLRVFMEKEPMLVSDIFNKFNALIFLFYVFLFVTSDNPKNVMIYMAIYFAGLVLNYLAYKPDVLTLISLCCSLLFFIISPLVLFHTPTYAKLLRVLAYGGGIHVQVIDKYNHIPKEYYLVLRTSTSIILYNKERRDISELSLGDVKNIRYKTGTLLSASYVLPEI